MFPLFRAIVKFCSTNRLFTYIYIYKLILTIQRVLMKILIETFTDRKVYLCFVLYIYIIYHRTFMFFIVIIFMPNMKVCYQLSLDLNGRTFYVILISSIQVLWYLKITLMKIFSCCGPVLPPLSGNWKFLIVASVLHFVPCIVRCYPTLSCQTLHFSL